MNARHRVVIVGGGFGGLAAAKALRRAPVDVTVVDRERRVVSCTLLAGWLVWLVVHLTFLTGFKNRASALFHWTISFFGRSRPERTITAQQVVARQALGGGGFRE